VLCRHVKNKDVIVHAVALDGLAGLAAALRTTREEAGDLQEALAVVAVLRQACGQLWSGIRSSSWGMRLSGHARDDE
jgi:hypothetical protein